MILLKFGYSCVRFTGRFVGCTESSTARYYYYQFADAIVPCYIIGEDSEILEYTNDDRIILELTEAYNVYN